MSDFRRNNGQYDYGNMERMCRCGHTLGAHSAHSDRQCFVGQNTDIGGPVCECPKFRPVRKSQPTK